MGWKPAISCEHRDNWGFCRVHPAHWLIRWLSPKGRAKCVFEWPDDLQDGHITCPDILEQPRHPGPLPPAKDD